MLLGKTSHPYILYPIIGYRFLPLQSNKFNFRLYFQPPIQNIGGEFGHPDILWIPVGMSIGSSF